MFVAIMAMAVILDTHSSPDPASLVDELGSSRYAERVSAEGELARLGRTALPALRAAKNSKDAEIRTRAVALLARIENSLLLESTPISLEFNDVPLCEAIETIGRQSGLAISLAPEERPRVADRRVNLRSDRPLPFWKAIDILASAGNLHYTTGELPAKGGLEAGLLLLDGPMVTAGAVSDNGAFRVHLVSVHYQSEIQLDLARSGVRTPGSQTGNGLNDSRQPGSASREFFLQFVLCAEPRLSITGNGAVKVMAAVDERGQALSSRSGPGAFGSSAEYFGISPSSIHRFRVDLDYPDAPGRRIKTLSGTIPVIVATRKPNPIVVPLDESRGRLYRSDEAIVTLIDHRPASTNQPAMVQVSIKPFGAAVPPINPGNGEPLGYRPDSFQQQIEILDAQGRRLSWFPAGSFYDGDETRLTLSVGNRGAADAPTTLRYHGILKANADVAFEFRDIPIP
jgi:hypothetical protein